MEARSFAVAQTRPVPGEVEANLEQHLGLARLAERLGARVLLFPELSLTGYELELAGDLAFTEDDPRLDRLAACASERELTLLVGAPVRRGSALHLGALVLAPDGSRALYAKRHLGAFSEEANPGGPLPPPEADVFQPGTTPALFTLDSHPTGLAICADVGHSEHAQEAATAGATSFLASMFVIPDDLATETARLRGYAEHYGMLTLLANYGAPTGGLPAAGRSAAWSPRGELLAELPREGTGVLVVREGRGGWRVDVQRG